MVRSGSKAGIAEHDAGGLSCSRRSDDIGDSATARDHWWMFINKAVVNLPRVVKPASPGWRSWLENVLARFRALSVRA